MSKRSRRGLLLFLLLAALALWLVPEGARTLRAAKLLSEALRPAAELTGGLRERTELVGEVTVLLYEPAEGRGPRPVLLLCHGAVDTGPREPRFVALARALAREGLLVACPELRSLASFRADPRDVDRLAGVARWLAERPDRGGEPLSMVGISIGGSYCLVAAAREELRERVDAVLAFGPYADLERLLTSWMVEPGEQVEGLYDPLVEGRRRVLIGNLPTLVGAEDRGPLRRALRDLLRGLEPLPEPGWEPGPEAQRLLACARSTAPIDPDTAAAALAPLVADLRALSPAADGTAPAALVFLLHGSEDPIVPPSETALLEAALERAGTRVRSHVTDAFHHVDARPAARLDTWSLARFVGAFLAAAGV